MLNSHTLKPTPTSPSPNTNNIVTNTPPGMNNEKITKLTTNHKVPSKKAASFAIKSLFTVTPKLNNKYEQSKLAPNIHHEFRTAPNGMETNKASITLKKMLLPSHRQIEVTTSPKT